MDSYNWSFAYYIEQDSKSIKNGKIFSMRINKSHIVEWKRKFDAPQNVHFFRKPDENAKNCIVTETNELFRVKDNKKWTALKNKTPYIALCR